MFVVRDASVGVFEAIKGRRWKGSLIAFFLPKVRNSPIKRTFGRLLLRKSVRHGISFRRNPEAMSRLTMMMRSIESKVLLMKGTRETQGEGGRAFASSGCGGLNSGGQGWSTGVKKPLLSKLLGGLGVNRCNQQSTVIRERG